MEHLAQEIAGEKRQRCGVGPEDRKIRERQEPGSQKAVIVTECLLGESVGAAGFRVAVHHVEITPGDDQHDRAAQEKSQRAAKGPRRRQIVVAGDDKRAPADAGSQGKGPGVQRRKMMSESVVFYLILH